MVIKSILKMRFPYLKRRFVPIYNEVLGGETILVIALYIDRPLIRLPIRVECILAFWESA